MGGDRVAEATWFGECCEPDTSRLTPAVRHGSRRLFAKIEEWLMRIFIYEFACGGGLAGKPLPDSLAREGWAMLNAVVEDFACVNDCQVITSLDGRLKTRILAAHSIVSLDSSPDGERRTIERLAADSDWTLVIAPESENILLDRVTWALSAGGRLLGSLPPGIAIASDKYACGRRLEEAGVPVVVGQVVSPVERSVAEWTTFPAVFKPRDGAGSQHSYLVRDHVSLASSFEQALSDGLRGDGLLQPYVPGKAASVSLLVGPHETIPLLAGEQVLSTDGRFRYLGGRMPLEAEEARRAIELATRAVATLGGLQGFVGVDLVLGPDTVIELNPRLTTSYVGLRRLSLDNLAACWLACCQGLDVSPIRWRPERICFQADGTIA